MSWVDVALIIVAVAAIAVAAYSWWHASKWAQLIAYGRIAIEYKGKVKIDAPLREWALWCKRADMDKAQIKGMRGQVIYALGGTRIAVIKGKKHAKVKPVKPRPGASGMQVRQGTWGAEKRTATRER